jgi:hypothetical protein
MVSSIVEYGVSYQYRIGGRRDGGRAYAGATKAETTLGLTPQLEIDLRRGFPGTFPGKLINATPQLMRTLMAGHDVHVNFQGKLYRFARLDGDGTFELRADGWS